MPTKSFQPVLFTFASQKKVSEQATTAYQSTTLARTLDPKVIHEIADDFIKTLSPKGHAAMQPRLERGLSLALYGAVSHVEARRYQVASSSIKFAFYQVDLDAKTCTCPDSTKEGHTCKHRFAAFLVDRALFSPEYLQPEETKPAQALLDLDQDIQMQIAIVDELWKDQQTAFERFEYYLTLPIRDDVEMHQKHQLAHAITEEAARQQQRLNELNRQAYELYIQLYGCIEPAQVQ